MAHDKGINPVVAGVFGAAVGVAAVKLTDKKNREKVEEKFGELKETGEKVKDKLEDFSSMASGKVEDAKESLDK